MAQNYASKFAKSVDERFYRESQAMLALNNDYDFSGVKTVKVYSIPVVAMNDYTRSGTNRYGTPEDLGTEVQELTVNKDRSWTFVIDRGDYTQSMMVTKASQALARQTREVVVPEFDAHVFNTIAKAAFDNGNTSATAATKSNAYELFLNAQETLGNKNVPKNCWALAQ